MPKHLDETRDFRAFVERAEMLLSSVPGDPHRRFKGFVQAANAIVRSEFPQVLTDLQPVLEAISVWLLPPKHDILRVARATWDEDAYTNLLAWWLRPGTHEPTALRRQQSFLAAIGLEEAETLSTTTEPSLRLYTDDGFPDLVMLFSDFAVVVEVKTGTVEHSTPSGSLQTVSYPEAVRRMFGLPDSKTVHTVFITVDRSVPANENAIPISFLDCVLAIAMRFRPWDFDRELGVLFQAWLTHLFIAAALPGMDIPSLVNEFRSCPADDDKLRLLRHLHTITLLHATFVRH